MQTLAACDPGRWRLTVTRLLLTAAVAYLIVTTGSADLWVVPMLPTVRSEEAENSTHDLSRPSC